MDDTTRKLLRAIDLLNQYGHAKFSDEWWPGNAPEWLGDEEGHELTDLLDFTCDLESGGSG